MSPTPNPIDLTHSRRWHEALVVYRRVCVLRRQNRAAEADALYAEAFEPVLAELSCSLDAMTLQTALLAEERRVEDAALVAEFVAPLLNNALTTSTTAIASLPKANSTTSARAKPAAHNVAAFIDDMLAQAAPPARR